MRDLQPTLVPQPPPQNRISGTYLICKRDDKLLVDVSCYKTYKLYSFDPDRAIIHDNHIRILSPDTERDIVVYLVGTSLQGAKLQNETFIIKLCGGIITIGEEGSNRIRLSPYTGVVPDDVDRFSVEEVDITNGSSAASTNAGNTKLLTTFPNLKTLRLFGLKK